MKKVFIVVIILLGIIVLIILASIGPYRLQQARKEAERFADESGISLEYPETIHVSSKGELLTTIWNLAIWEKETKETLNSVYGYSDEEYKKSLQPVSGYASKEELLANAMEDRWREERKSLTESIQGTIETMYGSRHNLFGLSKSTLLESYRREVFPYIIKTMKDELNDQDAYVVATGGLGKVIAKETDLIHQLFYGLLEMKSRREVDLAMAIFRQIR